MAKEVATQHFMAVIIGGKPLSPDAAVDQAIAGLSFDKFHVDTSMKKICSGYTTLGKYYAKVENPQFQGDRLVFSAADDVQHAAFVFDCGAADKSSPANIIWVEICRDSTDVPGAGGTDDTKGWRINYVRAFARCYIEGDPMRVDGGTYRSAFLNFVPAAAAEDLASVAGKNARFKVCQNSVYGTTGTTFHADNQAAFEEQWQKGTKGTPVT